MLLELLVRAVRPLNQHSEQSLNISFAWHFSYTALSTPGCSSRFALWSSGCLSRSIERAGRFGRTSRLAKPRPPSSVPGRGSLVRARNRRLSSCSALVFPLEFVVERIVRIGILRVLVRGVVP